LFLFLKDVNSELIVMFIFGIAILNFRMVINVIHAYKMCSDLTCSVYNILVKIPVASKYCNKSSWKL